MYNKEIPQNGYAILPSGDEEGVTQEEDDQITEQFKKEIHESHYSQGSHTI